MSKHFVVRQRQDKRAPKKTCTTEYIKRRKASLACLLEVHIYSFSLSAASCAVAAAVVAYFKDSVWVHLPVPRWEWKATETIVLHSEYGARIYEFILRTYFANFWPLLVHLPITECVWVCIRIFARLKLDPKSNFKFITRNIHSVANFSIRWISRAACSHPHTCCLSPLKLTFQ